MSEADKAANKSRMAVATLVLSAVGFIGVVAHEGFTTKAVIPVKGDVPTLGYGSTVYEDGTRVQMGDTITPERAEKLARNHISKDERLLRGCVTAPVSQVEYDILVDFAYQYGAGTACRSIIVRHINAGNYAAACHSYILYKNIPDGRNADGSVRLYDCSTPGNRRCPGVWTRSLSRRNKCLAAQ